MVFTFNAFSLNDMQFIATDTLPGILYPVVFWTMGSLTRIMPVKLSYYRKFLYIIMGGSPDRFAMSLRSGVE